MSFMPLEHFRRNDPEHIRKLNAVVDKLNALGPVSGAGGILVKRSMAGEQVASLDPNAFNATRGTYINPKALYATFEGAEAAQADTWDRANQGANDGVTFPWHVREVYSETVGKILYGYYRLVTIDSDGYIVSISAETRYIIDTPEAH